VVLDSRWEWVHRTFVFAGSSEQHSSTMRDEPSREGRPPSNVRGDGMRKRMRPELRLRRPPCSQDEQANPTNLGASGHKHFLDRFPQPTF